jgi:hypothetical protein
VIMVTPLAALECIQCSRSIFQNRNIFDIIWIQVANCRVIRHTIYYVKWRHGRFTEPIPLIRTWRLNPAVHFPLVVTPAACPSRAFCCVVDPDGYDLISFNRHCCSVKLPFICSTISCNEK